MLVDTPLINPQDSRMVPNTFEGVQLVSLPDKDRGYDYAAGYLVNIKPREFQRLHPDVGSLAGPNVVDRARRSAWWVAAGAGPVDRQSWTISSGLRQHRLRPGRVHYQPSKADPN